MRIHFSKLHRIDNFETITQENHYDFLHHLQISILLALREQGRLSAMQYRSAEEKLKQQRIHRARDILDKQNIND